LHYTKKDKVITLDTYNYTAKTQTGDIVSGKFDATDKSMVISLIKDKGYYPLTIHSSEEKGKEVKFRIDKRVKEKDLAIICRQFQTMLNAGVTVMSCLDMLQRQTENNSLKNALAKV
jgi:type IV pilus assembly protein PilC